MTFEQTLNRSLSFCHGTVSLSGCQDKDLVVKEYLMALPYYTRTHKHTHLLPFE